MERPRVTGTSLKPNWFMFAFKNGEKIVGQAYLPADFSKWSEGLEGWPDSFRISKNTTLTNDLPVKASNVFDENCEILIPKNNLAWVGTLSKGLCDACDELWKDGGTPIQKKIIPVGAGSLTRLKGGK